MNKSFIALISLFSSSVLADGYVGAALQYQNANIGVKDYQQVQVGGESLDLAADDAGTGVRLFAGYRLANNFGMEIGYSDFSLEAGKEVTVSALQDEEWDAEFKVGQLDLQLTYFYSLANKLTLKAGAGLVYHDADFDYGYKLDNEDAADQYLEQGNASDSKLGFAGSLSLHYSIWHQVDAIVGVQYSNSSLADSKIGRASCRERV